MASMRVLKFLSQWSISKAFIHSLEADFKSRNREEKKTPCCVSPYPPRLQLRHFICGNESQLPQGKDYLWAAKWIEPYWLKSACHNAYRSCKFYWKWDLHFVWSLLLPKQTFSSCQEPWLCKETLLKAADHKRQECFK